MAVSKSIINEQYNTWKQCWRNNCWKKILCNSSSWILFIFHHYLTLTQIGIRERPCWRNNCWYRIVDVLQYTDSCCQFNFQIHIQQTWKHLKWSEIPYSEILKYKTCIAYILLTLQNNLLNINQSTNQLSSSQRRLTGLLRIKLKCNGITINKTTDLYISTWVRLMGQVDKKRQ